MITPHSTDVEMSVLVVVHNVLVVTANDSISQQRINTVAWNLHTPPASNVVFLGLDRDIVTLAEHCILVRHVTTIVTMRSLVTPHHLDQMHTTNVKLMISVCLYGGYVMG